MILSFQLTMPNVGSWNGQWTGQSKKYYVIKKISKRYLDKQDHFKQLIATGKDSWYYRWDDGWGANVCVEIIDSAEATKRRKLSSGFCGYEWMIDSIIYYGIIQTAAERKQLA